MTKFILSFHIILFYFQYSYSIDKKNAVNWNNTGSSSNLPSNASIIDLKDFGLKSDNSTDNSLVIKNAIKALNGKAGILKIPAGSYLINKTISIPSNIVISGAGSDKTILNFNLNGNGDLFSIQGAATAISTPVLSGSKKESTTVKVSNAANFASGDYAMIKQNATHLLTSNWAYNYFFQLVKIKKISGNEITFEQPLHLDYSSSNNPVLVKINPVQQVGIESLKIKRNDATSGQTSNLFFNYAVNCWVKGVELENCNYAHINLQSSANITLSGNYIHDGFSYGSGGKAYGIVLQFGTSDNLIVDNIVKHLRHSFLLQAAANGNVIAYNYSYDPYWTEGWFPVASAGDVVLHGNYPYANLFEGNIFQNLVIDNSHGINGPYNTFFRNRIESYGIVMNNNSGDNMNFIANEITGSGLLKGLYTISGNHTAIGNNIKGSLQNGIVSETSLINKKYASQIGTPFKVNSWKNDAYIRNGKVIKTNITTSEPEIKQEVTPKKTETKTVKKRKKKCCLKKKK